MKKGFVSIIVVNWNGLEHLKDCLEALQDITYKDIEIIISDNGSTDGSIPYVKRLQRGNKKIILIENGKNLGFAEGNNVGFERTCGEYILFLNNDANVEKHFLEPLVEALKKNSDIAGVQPRILCYPNKHIIDSVGSYFLPTGFLYHYGHYKPDREKYHIQAEIFSMKGACMLFKKKVLNETGVFDHTYFAYFEETDLCHRTWLSGYKIMYIPNSEVYHKGGQTAKRLSNSFLIFHSYKNRIYTYLKNFELMNIIKIIPLHLLLCQITFLAYLFTRQGKQAASVQKAIVWNIMNWRMILQARKKTQSLRKVSDRTFLPKITRSVRISYYYHLFATALAGFQD